MEFALVLIPGLIIGSSAHRGSPALCAPVQRREVPAADGWAAAGGGGDDVVGGGRLISAAELETLERAAERIDKISMFEGQDQVLGGLVKLH